MDLNDKIVIYRTADGQTAVDVRMEILCGFHRHRWLNCFKRTEPL